MNGFHVQAVGWVLTFNAFALTLQEGHELSGLWAELVRARGEDKSRACLFSRLLMPRSIPLSEKSLGTFADLMDRMLALHPERFSCDALRRRRNHWAIQIPIGFLLGLLAVAVLPKGNPGAGAVVSLLFTIGCGFLVPTVTLWRAASAARCFSTNRRMKSSTQRKASSRFV